MKKIAAATLVATMALSLGAVDANAASNKMSDYNFTCNLYLDGVGFRTVKANEADKKFSDLVKSDNVEFLRASSDLGQAFGSSDTDAIYAANNAEAIKACINKEDYSSPVMTDSKKAGIIAGTVISALVLIGGVLAPVVGPMIQQFLPF